LSDDDKTIEEMREMNDSLEAQSKTNSEKIASLQQELQQSFVNHAADCEQKVAETKSTYQAKLSKAIDKLKDMKAEADGKDATISSLNTSLAAMKEELNSRNLDNRSLQEEQVSLKAMLVELEVKISSRAEIDDVKQQMEVSYIGKIAELEAQLESLSSSQAKAVEALKESESSTSTLLEKIASMNSSHEVESKEFQAQISTLISKIDELNQQLDASQSRVRDLEATSAQVAVLITKTDDLESELTRKNAELKSLDRLLQDEAASKQKMSLSSESSMIELKRDISDLQASIITLTNERNQFQQLVIDGEQKLIEVASQLSESLASAENDKVVLSSNLSALKLKLDEAEAMIRNITHDNDASLADALSEKDSEMTSLRAQLTAYESKAKEQDLNIKSLEAQLHEHVSNAQAKKDELEEANKQLIIQLDELQAYCDGSKNRINELEVLLQTAQDQLQDRESSINRLNEKINNLSLDNENYKANELKHQHLYESERGGLENQIQELQGKLSAANQGLVELQGRYEEKIEQLEFSIRGLNEQLYASTPQSSVVALSSQLEEKAHQVQALDDELTAVRLKLAAAEEHTKDTAGVEEKYQHEVAMIQVSVKDLEEEKKQLQRQLDDVRADSDYKKIRINELEAFLEAAHDQIQEKDSSINQLNEMIGHLLLEIKSSNTNKTQVQELQAALESKDKELIEFHGKLSVASQGLVDLQGKYEEKIHSLESSIRDLNEQLSAATALSTQLEEKDRQIQALGTDLVAIRLKLVTVEEQATWSQDVLQSEREALAKDLAAIEEKHGQELSMLQASIEELKEAKRQLEVQLDELQAESDGKKICIDELEATLQTVHAQIQEKDSSINCLNEKISSLSLEIEAYKSHGSLQIHELQAVLESKDKELIGFQGKLSFANQGLADSQERYEEKIQSLESNIRDLNEQLAATPHSSIEALSTQLEEKVNQVQTLDSELATIRLKLVAAEVAIRDAWSQAEREVHAKDLAAREEKHQQELATMQASMEELDGVKMQLQLQLEALQSDHNSLQTRLVDLERFLSNSQEEVSRMTSQLEAKNHLEETDPIITPQEESMSAAIADLERSLSEKLAENESLRSQLACSQQESLSHVEIIEQLEEQLSLQHRQEKELQDLIGSLHAEVEIVNQEKDEQTSRLKADREMIVSRANQHITELEEELQDTRYQYQTLNEQYIGLQGHFKEYESSFQTQTSDPEHLLIISAMENQKMELLARIDELEDQKKTFSSIITEKENLIEQLKDQILAANENQNHHSFSNNHNDEKIASLEAKIIEIQGEAKSKLSRAVDRIKELKAEVDHLNTTRIVELERERDSFKTQVIEAQEQFKQQTTKVIERMKELKKEVEAKSQRIVELESMNTTPAVVVATEQEEVGAIAPAAAGSSYEQRIQEFEADIVSLMERLSAANESERQLAEKYRELESKLLTTQQTLEERDTQIISYEDHVKSLTTTLQSFTNDQEEMSKLKKANENLKRRVDRFRQATESRLHPMQLQLQVEVIMRVQDPIDQDTIWCFVNRERSKAELSVDRMFASSSSSSSSKHSNADYITIDDNNLAPTLTNQSSEYTWYREADLDFSQLRSISASTGDDAHDANHGAVSFSIEGGDEDHGLNLPLTLQEQYQAQFESTYANERQELVDQLASLREELENSQKAFDVYRERAKTSLLKTANEQQTLEAKYQALQEQLKEEKAKSQSLEGQSQAKEEAYSAAQVQYEEKIQHEQLIVQTLRQTLLEANDEVTRYKSECDKLKAAQIKLVSHVSYY
jgi:chromosome segregation ATPase